jgi:hypothetical protein
VVLIQHRGALGRQPGELLQELGGQLQLALLQLVGADLMEEVGQRLGVERPLLTPVMEALVDLAEVEAQAGKEDKVALNGEDTIHTLGGHTGWRPCRSQR